MLCTAISDSSVWQSESAIITHIPPLSLDFLHIRSPQSTEKSSLCYTVGFHQLSILYIVLCICYPKLPIHPTTALCPLVSTHSFSSSVSQFLLCEYDHLYFTCKRYYMLFVGLFLIFFTLYDSHRTTTVSAHTTEKN